LQSIQQGGSTVNQVHRIEVGLRLRMKREVTRIKAQHRRLEDLRHEVTSEISRRSVETAGVAFGRFAEALEAHFIVEEQIFFPAVHGLDGNNGEAIEALLEDHARIRRRVTELRGHFSSGNGFGCAVQLDALVGDLRVHEQEEERVMASADEQA
jgi:iron-sulfur cluster repair protein YtfE (RIC family)